MASFALSDILTASGLATLAQVVAIDLMLAGDNVVVLGTLSAGLPARDRRRVLTIGVVIALVCLIGFALVATRLLQVVGLLFAGGLLLLWVGWKLFRELRGAGPAGIAHDAASQGTADGSFGRAVLRVALADLSMSLDNVLAVAGAARNHPAVLLVGLALSVTLMAVAASLISRIIERYRWIAYVGLLIILYVAGTMIYHGVVDPQTGIAQFIA